MRGIHSDTNFQSHCERQGNYHLAEPRGKTLFCKGAFILCGLTWIIIDDAQE